jgi:transposase-like protein
MKILITEPKFKRITPEQKERAFNLIKANPHLSIRGIARHLEINAESVAGWFKEWKLKRWSS